MGRPRIDWDAVRADFLATGMGYDRLGQKWRISRQSIALRASREKWQDARLALLLREEEKTTTADMPQAELMRPEELAAELREKRRERLLLATDTMMDRIVAALESVPPEDVRTLGQLIHALRELREMQGLNRSPLDVEEQRMRIEKLRRERDERAADSCVTVEFVDLDGAAE